MAASEPLVDAVDRTIDYFNRRTLDLPDGLFDRKTQFLINGEPFETLLSASPNDPLVLMLARGPAGYRFTVKALQHAVPDAVVQRGDINAPEPSARTMKLWLSGKLRGSNEPIEALVTIQLRLAESGIIEVVSAGINDGELAKIRDARLRP